MPTTKYQWRVLWRNAYIPAQAPALPPSSAAPNRIFSGTRHCRVRAQLVQPHQAEADDIHNNDVNHCSIHISIIPCAGAKGKRGGAYEDTDHSALRRFKK